MLYQLSFSNLLSYDAGDPGISIDIILEANGIGVTITAKLDSGAAHSIFARQYGEQLGFDIENGYKQTFQTVTGTFTAWGHEVTILIADIRFDAMVFFAADAGFNRNVIGRFGGLDNLKVGIVDYDGKL
jgi:hypothetical protein